MTTQSSVYITDEEICDEARRLYDTHPGIKSACEAQGMSRAVYVHRYALVVYRQWEHTIVTGATTNTNTIPENVEGVYERTAQPISHELFNV